MALTIIYIGIISYISSGSFCILEAIKTTKPSRSLSCFLGCTTRRKCQTNTSRSTLASLDFIRAEVGLTLFILTHYTASITIKTIEPETQNSVVVLFISRPPTALLCFVFYTWSSVTLHAPGLMNCLVSLFIIIKAQAWKTHYLILSNLAIFFLTFLMPCFFASLFISDGFL